MTAKQYLEEMYFAQLSIQKKEERIKELDEQKTALGGVAYDKPRVVTSTPRHAPFESTVDKIRDLQKKLNEEIAELADKYETGCRIINSLENVTDKLIFEMRYNNHMKWEDIAAEMNYSVSTIYYRHKNAMEKLKYYKL